GPLLRSNCGATASLMGNARGSETFRQSRASRFQLFISGTPGSDGPHVLVLANLPTCSGPQASQHAGFREGALGQRREPLHDAAVRRSRRKWKNSTPSRSRRFIIAGLITISPTIDAILPDRK